MDNPDPERSGRMIYSSSLRIFCFSLNQSLFSVCSYLEIIIPFVIPAGSPQQQIMMSQAEIYEAIGQTNRKKGSVVIHPCLQTLFVVK